MAPRRSARAAPGAGRPPARRATRARSAHRPRDTRPSSGPDSRRRNVRPAGASLEREGPLVDELLRALARVDLGRIDVALRVDGHVVDPVELARRAAVAAEVREHAARLAEQRPHVVVLAVGIVEERLAGVLREVHVPRRAAAARGRGHDELADEGAVLAEHLDAIVRAVADVEEAVA